MKVAAYYNLHKNTFSLQSRNKEDYGKVIKHTDHVILKNAKFTVRSAGRQKVLNENKKNVHAFVVGEVVEGLGPQRVTEKLVRYNPYRGDSFTRTDTGEAVSVADYVILRKGVDDKPIIGAYLEWDEKD